MEAYPYPSPMADFRTHAAFGVALGIVLALVAGFIGLVSGPGTLAAVFLLAALGAMAPDIDSDSGVPFHVTFGALSLVAGGFLFSSFLSHGRGFPFALSVSAASAAAVWTVGGGMFKKFTKHRGMAHSLPAAVLAGLLAFTVAGRLSWGDGDAFLLGVSATAGYLLHLLLDELYAAVDFEGKRFRPSRSLGSALKLFSSSGFANAVAYLGIVALLSGNVSRLLWLSDAFLANLR